MWLVCSCVLCIRVYTIHFVVFRLIVKWTSEKSDKWDVTGAVIDMCVGGSMCFVRMLSPKFRDHTHTIEVKAVFVSRRQFINCRL